MPKKQPISFDEFVSRVKKYLRAILTELKAQKNTIKRLEATVNGIKSEVDTLKARILSIEQKVKGAVVSVEKPTAPTPPPPEVGVDLDTILPELPAPPAEVPETSAEMAPTPPPAPAETEAPTPSPSAPSPPASGGEELFNLDQYLEKLDKLEIPEAPPVEESAPVAEAPIPEMTPESGEETKPVSSEELKKKEKDILKALSELEIA